MKQQAEIMDAWIRKKKEKNKYMRKEYIYIQNSGPKPHTKRENDKRKKTRGREKDTEKNKEGGKGEHE